MKQWKNENLLDRLLRLILAEVFIILVYFWFGGSAQIIFGILGAMMLVTAASGFCGLYKILKINTFEKYPKKLSKITLSFILAIVIVLPFLGAYYSNFFTRKIFLEDYNRMNNFYKQTLFNTGQDKRPESIVNYEGLVIEFAKFKNKYENYKPLVIKSDSKFNQDLDGVSNIILSSRDQIYNGDLPDLHKKYEEVRPVFQDILKRNNFSMLAVNLIDFHDIMEKVIEAADEKNSAGVISAYSEANDKLKAIEETTNDDEIKAIRNNLDAVLQLANEGKSEELSKKAAELKASFIKVYLKRG